MQLLAWLDQRLRKLPVWLVWWLCGLPLAWLVAAVVWLLFGGSSAAMVLGVDPVKAIEHELGLWGLKFLLFSLSVTPLRRLGLNLLRYRRALGVWSFLYIFLHLMVWLGLDMGLRWSEIINDLTKRPYIILGMLGFLMLLPLALTSTNAAIRRLGARRWRNLHRLSYVAVIAGALHFLMVTKSWQPEPLLYLAFTILLLALRLRIPLN